MKKTERRTRRGAGESAHADVDNSSSAAAETDQAGHLSLSEIKELLELVSEKQFNEFELEWGGFRLRLQKALANNNAETAQSLAGAPGATAIIPDQQLVVPAPVHASSAVPPTEEKLHLITSPIVGTFYCSPSPAAEAFIKLGDLIESGKTLCIIEAMKLMNEIQSDASGIVAKIFVENGQPVEYGQPLFGIKI